MDFQGFLPGVLDLEDGVVLARSQKGRRIALAPGDLMSMLLFSASFPLPGISLAIYQAGGEQRAWRWNFPSTQTRRVIYQPFLRCTFLMHLPRVGPCGRPQKEREEEKQKWKVCAGYSLTIDRSSLAHLSATAVVAVPR